MLNNKRQNYHHSKMPDLGEIVNVPPYLRGGGRKAIVESFNLLDRVNWKYSIGIHSVNVRFLDNGEKDTYSGFWLVDN